MKKFSHSRDAASKGAALMVVLAFVVLLAGVALAYFSRTTADRQLAHSSYNDTSSDLLARSALDIIVSNFKQELLPPNPNPPTAPQVTRSNIQPQRSGDDASIPNLIRRSVYPDTIGSRGVASLASAISSGPVDPNNPQRGEIKAARWNSHYLIPRSSTSDSIVDSTPISNFTPPDWVLVTRNGPVAFAGWNNNLRDPSSANYVVGRYAFAVYDEGGLLPMNLAGYPSWSNSLPCFANPAPTPWLVNVGRKGTVAFADLTALGSSAPSPTVIDNLVGWRNYAMTKRTFTNFPTGNPGFATDDCAKADFYGSYLLYFGDPPFAIESLADKLAASIYPFTSAAANVWNGRTDQAFVSRQQLLKLRSSLGLSQNVLQYMGTFSLERNRPAPDWSPDLTGSLSEGRFNLNNLALVVPNPSDCVIPHGKKRGWLTGKNRNHLCGTPDEIIELFGLFWVTAEALDNQNYHIPGHWTYIQNTGPNPPGDPNPNPRSIICFRGANQQADFFQILHYALNVGRPGGADRCAGRGSKDRTFAIGASLIDQYDSGADCDNYLPTNWSQTGCDLDSHVVTHNGGNRKYATHTTVIRYGQGSTGSSFAYGMEPNNRNPDPCPPCDSINGDRLYEANPSGNDPHRPQDAPTPIATTQVISHAFSNVGELGYGIDTLAAGRPTLDFSSPDFPDAPILDFFSYNPVSSAYPRAGIVNLYTRNAPVLAAMLSQTTQTDAAANVNPPSPVLSQSQAMTAATAIVEETQSILSGTTSHTDLTRAVAARLATRGGSALGWSYITEREKMESVARALAEVGQTRTWNLLIDVIAQAGHYGPNAQGLTEFISEGEKRYWLHIALGRDLIHPDGTPCVAGDTGCQVDVLGTQLEEVVE